ncbi:MAG: 3-hydroxyacyl-CoA dehydrogenase/enoyl-CoA hydratase family protein [Flavobacteriales bacterium]
MRKIRKVAVVGSGIMGTGIACHFANIGIEVLLLDILPKEPSAKQQEQGLTLDDPQVRNFIASDNLQKALKSNPSPIYDKKFADRITVGNLEDDLPKIKEVDWIIEVVVERLDIKKIVFGNIEKHRKPGTLISTNTSGIPINLMLEDRSDDFKKHFCGTHFFNPARYLKLLEIIPTEETSQEVIDFHMSYGAKFLGKTTVLCKDTPAFIGNRIGIFGIMYLFNSVKELGLSVSEIDKLTGPVIGRPKSATFRTADLVGLDTLIHVAKGLYEAAPNDEMHDTFVLPDYLQKLLDNGWLGSKSGQGFYKKTTDENGKKTILELNLETLEYQPSKKASFPTLELTKSIDDLKDRYKVLIGGKDKAGEFYRKSFAILFVYASNRIPEISDHYYKIDDAMQGGFAWKHGPFEIWNAIGLKKGLELAKAEGFKPAQWVEDMATAGVDSFYQINEAGSKCYYDLDKKAFVEIPGQENFITLENIRDTKTIWSNSGANIIDLGDGILNLEFRSKMNSLGGEVLQAINKAIDLAEESYKGLVIANEGDNFSVGANLGMIFMMAVEQEYDELSFAVKMFQDTLVRLRYSSIPVIAAPHNMALGGGCEVCLHVDKVVAHAELYMGLVEFAVGVIPGGGGSKEMTLRALEDSMKGDVEVNRVQEAFLNIGMAKVATSAYEAMNMKYLKEGRDVIVVNRAEQISIAKKHALLMYEQGYTQPSEKTGKVLGKQALAMFRVGGDSMEDGQFISEHDNKIVQKLGYVMSGGDLSEPTVVSERYLLDLERKAFLELCAERKTLERIQHMLTKGKPLRN